MAPAVLADPRELGVQVRLAQVGLVGQVVQQAQVVQLVLLAHRGLLELEAQAAHQVLRGQGLRVQRDPQDHLDRAVRQDPLVLRELVELAM